MNFLDHIENKEEIIKEAADSIAQEVVIYQTDPMASATANASLGLQVQSIYKGAEMRLINNIKLRKYIIKEADKIVAGIKKAQPEISEDIDPSFLNKMLSLFKSPEGSVNDKVKFTERYYSTKINGSSKTGKLLGRHNYFIFFDETHIEEIWVVMNNGRHPLYAKIACPDDDEINVDFMESER